MTCDQQFEALMVRLNEAEARVIALEKINQGLVDAVNQSDDDGKHVDLVWLTRDEMKEYSDVNQAGGINAIKADAIDILGNIMEREFGGHTGSFVRLYVDKLRSSNG